jgi:hypothetical protein
MVWIADSSPGKIPFIDLIPGNEGFGKIHVGIMGLTDVKLAIVAEKAESGRRNREHHTYINEYQ